MTQFFEWHHTLFAMHTNVIIWGFAGIHSRFFPLQPSPAVEFELAQISHWFAYCEDPGIIKAMGAKKIIFDSLHLTNSLLSGYSVLFR